MAEPAPEVEDGINPPDGLNPIQKALYTKFMSTMSLLLQSGFAVTDIVQMVRKAAQLQRSKPRE